MADGNPLEESGTFYVTKFDSVICEMALPLYASFDGVLHASGTAIVVARGLALSARHVLEDYSRHATGQSLSEIGHTEASFSAMALQFLDQGKTAVWWVIRQVSTAPFLDIAFLKLVPTCQKAADYKWGRLRIDLFPPKVGARVSAFGYTQSSVHTEADRVGLHQVPRTTHGKVVAVHEARRDSTMMHFPCYQVDARVDAGMSGGPVFSDEGKLCGILASSFDAGDKSKEHVSHVSSLWPAMAIHVDYDREGFPKGARYPALELAKYDHINASGWERVVLERDSAGKVISVGLRK